MFKRIWSLVGATSFFWAFGASAQETVVAKNWLNKSQGKIKAERPLDFVVCEAGGE